MALSELIVCRDARHALEVRRQIGVESHIRVIYPSPSLLSGPQVRRITVCDGVDLSQNVGGEGSLEALLRKRQVTYGEDAGFVRL